MSDNLWRKRHPAATIPLVLLLIVAIVAAWIATHPADDGTGPDPVLVAQRDEANRTWEQAIRDAEAAEPTAAALAPHRRPDVPDFNLLLQTDHFAGAHVYEDARPSEQVLAFRALLARGDAAALFGELLAHARTPGRLYGLCGLYLLDRPQFDAEFARFKPPAKHVTTQFGCITMPGSPVADLLPLIADGSFPAEFAPPRMSVEL